jgi:AcrR family transcriptional regulator
MQKASRGRRRGETRTREAILSAARRRFAEHGYDRASLRSIAADAGVDPALIAHFFGSKQRLFVAVVELPLDPEQVVPQVLAGPRSEIGERLARAIVSVLENREARTRVTGLVRAAATEPAAARMVRDLLTRRVFTPLAQRLGTGDALLRANLVGSQVVGLVMARYVVGLEPLASLPSDRLVAAIGPTFQRYLTDPLGA